MRRPYIRRPLEPSDRADRLLEQLNLLLKKYGMRGYQMWLDEAERSTPKQAPAIQAAPKCVQSHHAVKSIRAVKAVRAVKVARATPADLPGAGGSRRKPVP